MMLNKYIEQQGLKYAKKFIYILTQALYMTSMLYLKSKKSYI